MMKLPSGNTLKSVGVAGFIAASAVIGGPATLSHEGMKLKPYYDSVGVKTVCGGETEYVEDRQYTLQECTNLYSMRYGYYSLKTAGFYNETAKAIVTPPVHAALTDMSYNVGLERVRTSGMIRNINRGDLLGTCAVILDYKRAGGKDCSKPENKRFCGGIWTRRQQMHSLCMSGVTQ